MAQIINKIIVAKVNTTSGTVYLCVRNVNSITLDSIEYRGLIRSISNASRYGNFGDGQQIGTVNVDIVNAQEYYQDGYTYNVASVWNNRFAELRLCDVDNDTSWDDCEKLYRGIIKNFSIRKASINFEIDDWDYRNDVSLPKLTPEDLVNDGTRDYLGSTASDRSATIPNKSREQRIPIQIGDLTDTANGIFGKGVLITNKIGFQEVVFDTNSNLVNNGLGLWDKELERYFLARESSIVSGEVQGEYELVNSNKSALFSVNTTVTLASSVIDTSGNDTITVSDYTKIKWLDEETVDAENYPELLSPNILAIDSELILIIEKPTSNDIEVERGYNNTTTAAHTAGTSIYQSSQYSSRNLLTFNERFDPKALNNFYYGKYYVRSSDGLLLDALSEDLSYSDLIKSGKWSNIFDLDTSTYLEIENTFTRLNSNTYTNECDQYAFINFDFIFDRPDINFSVSQVALGVKSDGSANVSGDINPNDHRNAYQTLVNLFYAGDNTNRDQRVYYSGAEFTSYINLWGIGNNIQVDFPYSVDYYSEFERAVQNYPYYSPRYGTADNNKINRISSLKEKIKAQLILRIIRGNNQTPIWGAVLNLKIYNLALYIDMFVNFLDKALVSGLQGRTNGHAQNNILDFSGHAGQSIGSLADRPITALIDLLVNELGYLESEFSSDWSDVFDYQDNTSIYTDQVPTIAGSWGFKDKDIGWDLCQMIASHFLMSLVKNPDGSIALVNLHKLQSTGLGGYPTITPFIINIDNDVVVDGEALMFIMQQTGTDKIINDVKVNYNRNNSTDQYQSSYVVPDDYTLPESSITLSEARNTYYGGSKTKQMEIDAPFIYNDYDAERLAKWHINDKAEVFFWVELTLPYDYYDFNQGQSEQFKIGTLVSFDGNYAGIQFDTDMPFVIRNIIVKDNAQTIEIHCKSIAPISEFTSTADDGILEWQDTYDTGDEIQDTYNTGTEYQDIN